MAFGHRGPTFLLTYANAQTSVTSNSHVIAKYVPVTHMPYMTNI